MRTLLAVGALLAVALVFGLVFPWPVPEGCTPFGELPVTNPEDAQAYDTFVVINGRDYYCAPWSEYWDGRR